MRISPTFLLMTGVILVGANAFVLSPALSEVAHSLNTQTIRITWAISSFGAATAISSLLLSGFIDRQGLRRALTEAAMLLTAAQLLSSGAQTWWWLCLAQAVAGMAVGVLLPGIYAAATATAPPGQEAARLGRVLSGWALSLILAVPVSAWVTEHLGWRPVYLALAIVSGVVAWGFANGLPDDRKPRIIRSAPRAGPMRALRLPGIGFILGVSFLFMTAFYGCYAYFGEGIREHLSLSASGAGLYVLLYGIGFGAAGFCAAVLPPLQGRSYMIALFAAIGLGYWGWTISVDSRLLAALNVTLWGFLNQFGLNAMIVALTRRAGEARGAVMGLNSAVTYSAVFAGPSLMGLIYPVVGFKGVAVAAGACLLLAAALMALRPKDRYLPANG